MSYWVICETGSDDGRPEVDEELFDSWIEAFVYCKVQRADRGLNAEVYEAYDCAKPGCEAHPEWGFEFCDGCLGGERAESG